MIKKCLWALLLMWLVGCAGINRSCSSCAARNIGANWIVVQYDLTGVPIMCWELPSTSVDNETNSDGIYWQDAAGNLVHISGLYNRVMVKGDKWEEAFRSIGISRRRCRDATRERNYWLNEQYGDEPDLENLPPHKQ